MSFENQLNPFRFYNNDMQVIKDQQNSQISPQTVVSFVVLNQKTRKAKAPAR